MGERRGASDEVTKPSARPMRVCGSRSHSNDEMGVHREARRYRGRQHWQRTEAVFGCRGRRRCLSKVWSDVGVGHWRGPMCSGTGRRSGHGYVLSPASIQYEGIRFEPVLHGVW